MVHFKLRAHLLDLRGLLAKLGRESLYLFLLLRDRCLQLLNFVIEHGLVYGGARQVAVGHEAQVRHVERSTGPDVFAKVAVGHRLTDLPPCLPDICTTYRFVRGGTAY